MPFTNACVFFETAFLKAEVTLSFSYYFDYYSLIFLIHVNAYILQVIVGSFIWLTKNTFAFHSLLYFLFIVIHT